MQPINYPAQPIATQHQITLHGETIQYTAHVGFMPIHQATSGVTEGHLFYVYYSKNGVTDKSKRPVWFLFNGGPGAATVWLHMGAFGPKMVKMEPNGTGHAAAVHLRRQSQLPAGYRRPGLHRRHGHGLQPPGPARISAPISAAWRTTWPPSASSSAAS